MRYRCWAEVDLTALSENLAWIKHRVGPASGGGARVITVVKADAYGHGLKQIAGRLMQSGTDVFGVANLAEAQVVQKVGKGWPVLMLGSCLPEEVASAVSDGVMATVSNMDEARRFSKAAARQGRTARIHLKVDTGMGRLGVSHDEVASVFSSIRKLPAIDLVGLYTHYASVEDDPVASRQQAERFAKVVADLGEDLPEFVHVNNSGAVLLEQGTRYNAVRPGLLVYGVVPQGKRRVTSALKQVVRPALQWKSRVGLVKVVNKGTRLSYGGEFVAPRKMRVATVTAGFGDGYMRAGSNRAYVLIGGRRCRIVGRITMDQMLADVTGVEAEPGDDVVLIGKQGSKELTATELSGLFGTVSWEVLTNISYRVPRIYRGAEAS